MYKGDFLGSDELAYDDDKGEKVVFTREYYGGGNNPTTKIDVDGSGDVIELPEWAVIYQH